MRALPLGQRRVYCPLHLFRRVRRQFDLQLSANPRQFATGACDGAAVIRHGWSYPSDFHSMVQRRPVEGLGAPERTSFSSLAIQIGPTKK